MSQAESRSVATPSRSKSSIIFSPRLKIITQLFGLQIEDVAADMVNESKTKPSSPDRCKYEYVYTSDGIEVRQPKQKADDARSVAATSIDESPSSIYSTISHRSDLLVRDIPSQWGVEKADDECEILSPVPQPLYKRRGRNIANLNDQLCTKTEDSSYEEYDTGYISSESPLMYPPINRKYILVKEVGSGGEGQCSLVKRKTDSELRVIKTVKRVHKVAGKPIEAMMLQDVFPDLHDNVIRLHNYEFFGRDTGVRYYFDYCNGGDLYDLVSGYHDRGLYIPELFIWKAFTQLASALEYLHRGFDRHCEDPDRPGICHRDIKPENIFLRLPTTGTGYPDLVLADFGCATFEFATYDRRGTFAWQGPELPRQSPKGDVYSLGAVIHYMIYLELHIGPLPPGVTNTRHNQQVWDGRPEARQPKTHIPEPYTIKLVEFMHICLNPEHNTRIDANRLQKGLKQFADTCLPKFDGPDDESHDFPLAYWAFGKENDGRRQMVDQGRGSIPSELGTEQYFQMMDEWEAEKYAGRDSHELD